MNVFYLRALFFSVFSVIVLFAMVAVSLPAFSEAVLEKDH